MNPIKNLSVLACLSVAVAVGCKKPTASFQMPPPNVTVAPVEQRELVERIEFTGRAAAMESVEVRPRVSGYIQEVKFQSGQLVKKDDVLFVIDPRWHQATLDQWQAEFDQARLEAERVPQLLATKAISAEEAEARKAHFASAKAALDTAKLDLDYTQVRSPIDGRVSRAWITAGNYVSGGPGMNSVLTTLVSVDPIYVYADVDENSLLKFNALMQAKKIEVNADGKVPVELQLGDEENFPHQGVIESFDNRLDPATGSIVLRSIFSNADGRIVPGLFARIRVPASERHTVLLVDDRAIGTDQAQKFVLTLTPSNTVAYRPVKLGPTVDGKRIIREGLAAGEKIVVNGLARVRPGMPVSVQPTDAELKSAKP